jgi:hypothetical protein
MRDGATKTNNKWQHHSAISMPRTSRLQTPSLNTREIRKQVTDIYNEEGLVELNLDLGNKVPVPNKASTITSSTTLSLKSSILPALP